MTPSRFTSIKIAFGYSVLLAVLLFSLFFVRREMDKIAASDNRQELMTDSLLVLLREKDQNTLRTLRALSDLSDSLLAAKTIEEVVAEHDTVITQQRVQYRVVTRRDSLITRKKKKNFFKRLAEVFVPSKEDTALLVNSSTEYATDTIVESYNPMDSLNEQLKTAREERIAERRTTIHRRNILFRKQNKHLTSQIDSLIKRYEQKEVVKARQEAEKGLLIRKRSSVTLGWIAAGAVFLSALFLSLSWRDISRSNRYRRKLEEANRRAEELLRARENLMLAITHDFKAPLGSILGYIDLLAQVTKDEQERSYLENMKGSSRHLLKLVTDLLDFHRLDLNKAEINRVTFNPSQLFAEIQVSFEPLAAAAGLCLECQVAPELNGCFISDPLRIRQIVNNLLSNAIKFTSEGKVKLCVTYQSSKIQIVVEDTGQGMEPADRNRIFQEFTRLSTAQGKEGFGLGLSIVKKLVMLLEGSITVDSVLGKGSAFTVVLPLYPWGGSLETACSAAGEQSVECLEFGASDATLQSKFRVLMIDDDKIQLSLTEAMLRQRGIQSVGCMQVEALIEHLRTESFDLLLTDVQMPSMNGFDLLHLLRASNIHLAKSIPVIAVTARSDMDEAEFVRNGFSGCLHKPFTVDELLEKVRSVADDQSADIADTQFMDRTDHDSFDEVAEKYVFRALTAFADKDVEAARNIMQTFLEDTTHNLEQIAQSLEHSDFKTIASLAHKMLPLFRLIQASEMVSYLEYLEKEGGEESVAEKIKFGRLAVKEGENILEEARAFFGKINF